MFLVCCHLCERGKDFFNIYNFLYMYRFFLEGHGGTGDIGLPDRGHGGVSGKIGGGGHFLHVLYI